MEDAWFAGKYGYAKIHLYKSTNIAVATYYYYDNDDDGSSSSVMLVLLLP